MLGDGDYLNNRYAIWPNERLRGITFVSILVIIFCAMLQRLKYPVRFVPNHHHFSPLPSLPDGAFFFPSFA